MLSKGELIALRPHTRFVHFPTHSHDFVEVIYMVSGSTIHFIDGEEICLKEGELLFLGQSVNQEILPAGKDDIAVNFIILPEFFDKTLKMIDSVETPLFKFIVDCLTNKRVTKGFLHFEVCDVLPVQNMIENLIFSLVCEKTAETNIVQTTMGLLIMQLIRHTDRLISQPAEEKTIVKVLRYVEENYKEANLKSLSEILHYDVSTLSREIKSKTGKNFTDIVQEKRLSVASFLLRKTNMNTEDIAKSIGYENISFFHRLFKAAFGVTPKKYRDR